MDQVSSLLPPRTPAPAQWQWVRTPGTGPGSQRVGQSAHSYWTLQEAALPSGQAQGRGSVAWASTPLSPPGSAPTSQTRRRLDSAPTPVQRWENLGRELREGGGVGGSAGDSPGNRPLQEGTFMVTLRNNSTYAGLYPGFCHSAGTGWSRHSRPLHLAGEDTGVG